MFRYLWYRVLNLYQYMFTKDPVGEWIDSTIGTLRDLYEARDQQSQREIEFLKSELKDKNRELNELQKEVIYILSSINKPEVINPTYQAKIPDPISMSRGWGSERDRLERRARKDATGGKIENVEADLDSSINSTTDQSSGRSGS